MFGHSVRRYKKPYPVAGKVFVVFVAVIGLFFYQGAVSANTQKSYSYDLISVVIGVNEDTTIDVTERQRFNFNGELHKGWRSIPLRKIDAVTDVVVIDDATGKPLEYTPKRLSPTNPDSWGKYTYYKENGAVNVEWYYSAKNEKRDWAIQYKVYGAIAFYDDYDELYWNLLTDYRVPVSYLAAVVVLPQTVDASDELQSTFYSSITDDPRQNLTSYRTANNAFYYSAQNIHPRQRLTLALGWPKGIVDQSAYFAGLMKLYWGYVMGGVIALLALITGFLYWFFTEKYHTGRGTIIPRYTPPENLPPAMAEALVYERVSEKTWPATLVDLAVRGYITIKEDKPNWLHYIIFMAILILFVFIFSLSFIGMFYAPATSVFTALVGAFIYIIVRAMGGVQNILHPKEYIIKKSAKHDERDNLRTYEKDFLDILFEYKDVFSTKELKKVGGAEKRRSFSMAIEGLKDELYKEFERGINVYEKKLNNEKIWKIGAGVILLGALFALDYGRLKFADITAWQWYFVLLVSAVSALLLLLFILYEARLNKRGQILREDWLGFKMYLETAEKYRMQNLTPEIFEKYLPYAMVFGVEKKWAKAFADLNMPQPGWYSGRGYGYGSAASFSSASFASSLSASFASSFSSAGGGGASGGGGFAGGGAGGGGGGAS